MLKKPKLEEAPWARVGGKIKDAFADQTKLGIAKNTITGLPKATKKVAKKIVRYPGDLVERALRIEDNMRKQQKEKIMKRARKDAELM